MSKTRAYIRREAKLARSIYNIQKTVSLYTENSPYKDRHCGNCKSGRKKHGINPEIKCHVPTAGKKSARVSPAGWCPYWHGEDNWR